MSIHALPAQPTLTLGDVDTSAYPALVFPFRIVNTGALFIPGDDTPRRLAENGDDLSFTIDCPERRRLPVSVAVGVERSLVSLLPEARNAARAFIRRLRFTDNNDEASLWTFATFIDLRVPVTRDSTRLDNEARAIADAPFPFNGTALYECMHRAVEDINEFGRGAVRAIVFFTDGVNNTRNFSRTLDDVATRANTDAIRVFVIGVGNKPDGQAAMIDLCRRTNGFFVHASNPRAIDSVYNALSLEPVDDYWCGARYVTPLCANGSVRTVNVSFSLPGDTAESATSYKAPRRPWELDPVPAWASPASFVAATGDTVVIALGFSPSAGMELTTLRLAVRHAGMETIGAFTVHPDFTGWSIQVQSGLDQTQIEIRTGGATVPPGDHTFLYLSAVARADGPHQASVQMSENEEGCATLVPASPRRSIVISADTSYGIPGRPVFVALRARRLFLPEGIQAVALRVTVPSNKAAFVTGREFTLSPALAGWHIHASAFTTDTSVHKMALELHGPPVTTTTLIGEIGILPRQNARESIPVSLEQSIANNFAPVPGAVYAPGLVMLSDTCRTTGGVRREGLTVSPAMPNPSTSEAVFRVSVTRETRVRVELFDVLGRRRQVLPPHEYTPGVSLVRVDFRGLPSGMYIARFSTGTRVITRTLVLVR